MWKETDKGKTGHREIEGGGLSPPHTTTIWFEDKTHKTLVIEVFEAISRLTMKKL